MYEKTTILSNEVRPHFSIGLALGVSAPLPTVLAQEVAPSAPPSPVRLHPCGSAPTPARRRIGPAPDSAPPADEKPFSLDFRGGLGAGVC